MVKRLYKNILQFNYTTWARLHIQCEPRTPWSNFRSFWAKN